MKKLFQAFWQTLQYSVFPALSICLIWSACHKEPQPEIYGQWETISNGFKWNYQISENQFCRTLPEFFGETQFCFPYEVKGDTLNIQFNDPEKWVWNILESDVAIVTNLTVNETYVVKRTK